MGDRDVDEADGHVGDGEHGEHPKRAPPGPGVADRVELPPVEPQDDDQRHGTGGGQQMPSGRQSVDHHAGGQQQDHSLPGAPLPPAQPVREHEQQQADDDVGDTGHDGQQARRDLREPVQGMLEMAVQDPGPEALDDVRQADQQREQRRRGSGGRAPGSWSRAAVAGPLRSVISDK